MEFGPKGNQGSAWTVQPMEKKKYITRPMG